MLGIAIAAVLSLCFLAGQASSHKTPNKIVCAGDDLPRVESFKPGQSVSFPDRCAYDYQGGIAKTAGGGRPLLVETR